MAKAQSPVPKGYHTITPHLVLDPDGGNVQAPTLDLRIHHLLYSFTHRLSVGKDLVQCHTADHVS